MGCLLITNKSDKLKIFSRYNGKLAFRHDLKDTRGGDCGIDVVCLKKHRRKNSVWICMCMDVHMNACAYFTHFTHIHIKNSLNVLFTHFHSERKLL